MEPEVEIWAWNTSWTWTEVFRGRPIQFEAPGSLHAKFEIKDKFVQLVFFDTTEKLPNAKIHFRLMTKLSLNWEKAEPLDENESKNWVTFLVSIFASAQTKTNLNDFIGFRTEKLSKYAFIWNF